MEYFFKNLFSFEREDWGGGRGRAGGVLVHAPAEEGQRKRERIPNRLHAVTSEPDAGLQPHDP